jgi:hypothetical protein
LWSGCAGRGCALLGLAAHLRRALALGRIHGLSFLKGGRPNRSTQL